MRCSFFLLAIGVAACGGEVTPSGGASNNSASTPATRDSVPDAGKCEADVAPNELCPATWAETVGAGKAFCSAPNQNPDFGLARSTGACGPWLRYSLFLFDAGPRNCLYDPQSEKLVGYGFYDGKGGWEQRTCNVMQEEASFPTGCASVNCEGL